LTTYEQNHQHIAVKNKIFPIISLSKNEIRKTGKFSKKEVEEQFKNNIKIDSSMKEPLSYYPFSENDDKTVIIPYVLRAIVTILTDKRRKGRNVFDSATFDDDEILTTIHKMWDTLSEDHKKSLKTKINTIIRDLHSSYPKFNEQIESIRASTSSSTVSLSSFIETCNKIISEEEQKVRLSDYPQMEL
jgi:hypothetical protein